MTVSHYRCLMKPFIANADKAAPRVQNDLQLDLTVLTSLTEPFTTAGQRLFRYIVYLCTLHFPSFNVLSVSSCSCSELSAQPDGRLCVITRVAVDMKFPIHIHIHIHRCLSCMYPQTYQSVDTSIQRSTVGFYCLKY